MNHIHWSLFLQLVSISSLAQDDAQMSFQTGKNIFSISSQEGFDMILFEPLAWDSMVRGTKYMSSQLTPGSALPVFIQVSCKSSGCRSGLGFTCSIFDREICDRPGKVLVNHDNRFSSALIRKQPAGTIELLLLDTIDWPSLEYGSNVRLTDD